MFYINFDTEVITEEMIKTALKMGKTVAIPRCLTKKRRIVPYKIGLDEPLIRGPYGVREPASRMRVPVSRLDAVIVPGVAFDKKGNRLGRGKGYYDRFLASLPKRTFSVGLAFRQQILPSIPLLRHDISVDKTVFA